ncbi:dihydrofolate reductase [Aestuariispira insulae]|uniref:Dihydrofolate reductase n=1 Tax=Aestuariispira insulae TaxID=1461337 RepID=A0A3D9HWW9_9PROT|nr:dihydrofolate reductase [Aestuariispira insulae]RED54002.1 dihydrofolate reductase [Aestuariispira insulae]
MRISQIVAMGRNHVIGREGGLPWHLSGDLKFFKATTMGKPIVMGRKTFESIGRPLPGRPNIVITRQQDYAPEGVSVCATLEEALDKAKTEAERLGVEDVMIIGGAQIYASSLNLTDRLYITEVDLAPDGDAHFPEFDRNNWQEISRETVEAVDDIPEFAFVIYDRRS